VTATTRVLFFAVVASGVVAPAATCGDERDQLIQEYAGASVSFLPDCSSFTKSGHSSHFAFSELNTGDYLWAILTNRLLKGIEDTRTNTAGTALVVTSAYRNPLHNGRVSGATDSQHIHGTAVDFKSDQLTWDMLQRAGKQAGACSEPQGLSGWGHVHLDWRGPCPANW
jgi:hypothetical protein